MNCMLHQKKYFFGRAENKGISNQEVCTMTQPVDRQNISTFSYYYQCNTILVQYITERQVCSVPITGLMKSWCWSNKKHQGKVQ